MFKDLKEIMNIMREEIEDLIIEVETIKGQIPDGKIFTIWNEYLNGLSSRLDN